MHFSYHASQPHTHTHRHTIRRQRSKQGKRLLRKRKTNTSAPWLSACGYVCHASACFCWPAVYQFGATRYCLAPYRSAIPRNHPVECQPPIPIHQRALLLCVGTFSSLFKPVAFCCILLCFCCCCCPTSVTRSWDWKTEFFAIAQGFEALSLVHLSTHPSILPVVCSAFVAARETGNTTLLQLFTRCWQAKGCGHGCARANVSVGSVSLKGSLKIENAFPLG